MPRDRGEQTHRHQRDQQLQVPTCAPGVLSTDLGFSLISFLLRLFSRNASRVGRILTRVKGVATMTEQVRGFLNGE
jgi:hypothetical protein